MIITNVHAKKVKRDVRFELQKNGETVHIMEETKPGFVSIYEINEKCYELIRFSKDKVLYYKYLDLGEDRTFLQNLFLKLKLQMGTKSDLLLQKIYGKYICIGFNNIIKVSCSFEFINKLLNSPYANESNQENEYCNKNPYEIYDETEMKPYNHTCDAISSLGRMNWLMTAAYIENIGNGSAAIRIFSGYKENIFEHSRVIVTPDKIEFLCKCGKYYYVIQPDIEHINFAIVGYDNLDDTYIRHFQLSDSVSLCYSLMHHGIENLVKMDYENIYNVIMDSNPDMDYDDTETDMNIRLQELFGEINFEAKSFEKMIGIPNRLLTIINENKEMIINIKGYKALLKDQIWFIDIDTFRIISVVYNQFIAKWGRYNQTSNYVISLIHKWHPNVQMLQYLSYLKDIPIAHINTYIDYLNIVDNYDLYECGFKWNPKNIPLEHERATEIMNAINIEKDEKKYGNTIKELKKQWKKLEFTYDEYSIISPKDVKDIAREGNELNHCVRTYLDDIANGKTTIMFIRENGNLDNPFFTLEIRDGKMRQCHGFNNCGVTYKITKLLTVYSKEKGIEMLDVNHNDNLLADE